MTGPDFQTLPVPVSGHVAAVTMNRAEVRDALNALAHAEPEAALRRIQADGDVRVVVRTGALGNLFRIKGHTEGVAGFIGKRVPRFNGC